VNKSIQNLKDEFTKKESSLDENLENINASFENEINNLKNILSETLKKVIFC
jgi:hypothetical protein